MRKNIILFLGIIAFMVISIPNMVFAEDDNLCEYVNYYFFSDIEDAGSYTPDGKERITRTYFPALTDNGIVNIGNAQMLCLTGANDSSTYSDNYMCPEETWTLNDFWGKYLEVLNGKNVASKTFTDGNGKSSNSKIKTETKTIDNKKVIVRYYVHGTWYDVKREDDGSFTTRLRGQGTDLSKASASSLTQGSFFPSVTQIELPVGTNNLEATVHRTITTENFNTVTNAPKLTGTFCASNGCKLAPALSKLIYKAECKANYKATIDYVVKDANGKETKITFEDGSKNPWTKSGLKDGDSIQEGGVKSPEYKNCEPDVDVVTGEIPSNTTDNGDFYQKVTYTCPTEVKEDKYTATIRYYVENYDGEKIEIVEENDLSFDDDDAESPWIRKDLANGYKTTVKSPSLKGCSTTKKSVDVEIKGQNFSDEVVYTCKIKNQETGTALIYTAWIIGGAALAYAIWYLINENKPKKEEEKKDTTKKETKKDTKTKK